MRYVLTASQPLSPLPWTNMAQPSGDRTINTWSALKLGAQPFCFILKRGENFLQKLLQLFSSPHLKKNVHPWCSSLFHLPVKPIERNVHYPAPRLRLPGVDRSHHQRAVVSHRETRLAALHTAVMYC